MLQVPTAGSVVEFLHANIVQIAFVLEDNNGKLRLLLPNRREMPLHQNRLLPWFGPSYKADLSKEEIVQILNKHQGAREKIAEEINVFELWEISSPELNVAKAQWFSELIFSEPSVDHISACARALFNFKSHFKFNGKEFEIFSAEYVADRIEAEKSIRAKEKFVKQTMAWFSVLWDIHCKKRKLEDVEEHEYPSDDVILQIKNLLMLRLANPEHDQPLWKSLTKLISDDIHLALFLATAWELVPPHYNYLLDVAGYSANDTWANQFEKETQVLNKLARRELENKLDYPFISIDGVSTSDIDDAFYIEEDGENYRLFVALSCPALNWNFGTPLDKTVASRATSLYLPEGSHHMLPECLGTNTYSLKSDSPKQALIFNCLISKDGKVIEFTPSICTVNIAENLTYFEAEDILTGKNELENNRASKYSKQLILACDLAKARKELRVLQGAVIIEKPEPKVVLNYENNDVVVSIEEEENIGDANLLVSEIMILANASIGAFAIKNDFSLLYRTQDITIPREYVGVWTQPHKIAKIIRALTPAKIETSPRQHVGIGEAAYAPVSSPLRRYQDLINEAQVVHFIQNASPKWSKEELENLALQLSIRLESVGQVQKTRPRYWKLLYFKQQGDRKWWDGVITDENDNFVWVNLVKEQIFLRARRNLFSERTHPGTELQVRINKVNPLRNEMHLAETMDF